MADYLIVGTLHILAVNSVQSLFNYYTEQLENTPTLAEIQATNKILYKKSIEEKNQEEQQAQQEIQAHQDMLNKEMTGVSKKEMMMYGVQV